MFEALLGSIVLLSQCTIKHPYIIYSVSVYFNHLMSCLYKQQSGIEHQYFSSSNWNVSVAQKKKNQKLPSWQQNDWRNILINLLFDQIFHDNDHFRLHFILAKFLYGCFALRQNETKMHLKSLVSFCWKEKGICVHESEAFKNVLFWYLKLRYWTFSNDTQPSVPSFSAQSFFEHPK